MKKTRTLLAAAAAIAGLVAFAGPAQAVPPRAVAFEVDLPGTNEPDVGDDGYCSFPVHIEGVSNQQVTGPHNHVTGFGSATVTNVDTGETLKFKISGPGTITPLDGGYTIDGTGGWLLFTTVENSSPAGVLQLAYTTGHVQVTVDETGHTTSYKLNGKSTDVCAALS